MEGGNPNKLIVESPHILGKIYRGVDTKSFYLQCVKAEHDNAILLNYEFSHYIMPFNKNDKQTIKFHLYLK